MDRNEQIIQTSILLLTELLKSKDSRLLNQETENYLETYMHALRHIIKLKNYSVENFEVVLSQGSLERKVVPLDNPEGYFQYYQQIRREIEEKLGI